MKELRQCFGARKQLNSFESDMLLMKPFQQLCKVVEGFQPSQSGNDSEPIPEAVQIFLVSVDGIHCRTYEVRSDPGKKWYSHKSHSAGVGYELAIAIRDDRFVWMNGPFHASKADVTIFRFGDGDENNPGRNLRDMIPDDKRAIADYGYVGEDGKTAYERWGRRAAPQAWNLARHYYGNVGHLQKREGN